MPANRQTSDFEVWASGVAQYIEILHTRDPDGECAIEVWVYGKKLDLDSIRYVDVDPGRGYTRADWEEAKKNAASSGSPGFTEAVRQTYDAWADSQFIESVGDGGAVEFEYDLEYSGGNYSDVGETVLVPASMVTKLGASEAFREYTGIDPVHIVQYHDAEDDDDDEPEGDA